MTSSQLTRPDDNALKAQSTTAGGEATIFYAEISAMKKQAPPFIFVCFMTFLFYIEL